MQNLPPPVVAVDQQDPDKTLATVGLVLFVVGFIIPFLTIVGWIISIVAWRKSVNRGYKNTMAFVTFVIGAVIYTLSILVVMAIA